MRAPNLPVLFHPDYTVGFGIAPNLLTPPIARRALAGFGDRSPLPPVGTFTPPRERGRTEIRPMRLMHLSPSHATIFASSYTMPSRRRDFPRPMTIIRPHVIHAGAALGCERSLDAC